MFEPAFHRSDRCSDVVPGFEGLANEGAPDDEKQAFLERFVNWVSGDIMSISDRRRKSERLPIWHRHTTNPVGRELRSSRHRCRPRLRPPGPVASVPDRAAFLKEVLDVVERAASESPRRRLAAGAMTEPSNDWLNQLRQTHAGAIISHRRLNLSQKAPTSTDQLTETTCQKSALDGRCR